MTAKELAPMSAPANPQVAQGSPPPHILHLRTLASHSQCSAFSIACVRHLLASIIIGAFNFIHVEQHHGWHVTNRH
jgi:hypothetical protein